MLQIIAKPFHYIHEHHKTDSLPIFAFALNRWMKIPENKLIQIVEILKLVRDGIVMLEPFSIYMNVYTSYNSIDKIFDFQIESMTFWTIRWFAMVFLLLIEFSAYHPRWTQQNSDIFWPFRKPQSSAIPM